MFLYKRNDFSYYFIIFSYEKKFFFFLIFFFLHLKMAELKSNEEEIFVEGMKFPEGTLALTFGQSQSGKSTLMT